MKIKLTEIRKKALERPLGYFEDIVSRGVIKDDYLEIPPHEYAFLINKYRPKEQIARKSCCGRR